MTAEQVRERLVSIGFADWRAADRALQRIADEAQVAAVEPTATTVEFTAMVSEPAAAMFADLLPHLLSALSGAANPDRVLVSLERLVHNAPDRPALLRYLASNPRAVEVLAILFAGSQFLTEILLRHPGDVEQLVEHSSSLLRRPGSPPNLVQPQSVEYTTQPNFLRRFQRRELLRIGACDLLGLFDLPAVIGQLSSLADNLVCACLDLASAQTGTPVEGFAVLALGKLGGSELNYSSDIDLLFLASQDANRYLELGEQLIDALVHSTDEGFLYRVDMRLRPWGQAGPLVSTVDAFLAYLRQHARLWEKQALLKARTIAGDRAVGEAFLRQAESLLFSQTADVIRSDVRAMKERTEAQLRRRGREWGEVKLGEGSIRDIEFVAQYLQLAFGRDYPEIRSRGTLDALERLLANHLLSTEENRILSDGYIFLRTIEHHLQMMHYRQIHELPTDVDAFTHLARRLGFGGEDAGAHFLARYEEHRAAIRAVYLKHLGSKQAASNAVDQVKAGRPTAGRRPHGQAQMAGFNACENMSAAGGSEKRTQTDQILLKRSDEMGAMEPTFSAEIGDHLARMDASYAATFSEQEIELHAALAGRLDRDRLAELYAIPLDDDQWRVTIVAFDYPGELSLICGLLFAYGLSISGGDVFTYELAAISTSGKAKKSAVRRKIVDVFTVHPVRGEVTPDTWLRYADELAALLKLSEIGAGRSGGEEARSELSKRVAAALHESSGETAPLYPIDIEIDNDASERYTVLRIGTQDTPGFLYEFANALAINHVYIVRVSINSVGNRVHDTLYVTDADGNKIVSSERQRELRAAVVLIKHFTHLLPRSPDPASALLHFRQYISQLFQRADWPGELASLEQPKVLNALAQLLGVSNFLWDDFLRMQHANLFPVVRDVDALPTAKSRAQLQTELEAALKDSDAGDMAQPPAGDVLCQGFSAHKQAAMNAFKDREMFRIDMRHILGHTQEFHQFSDELTDLVEVIVNAAYHLAHEEMRLQHGTPLLDGGQISEMAVCALGKCGGRELGFASDIELMFIYCGRVPPAESGWTSGPQVLSLSEFYEKVVQAFVNAIQARREGIFQVDLRLRPYGKSSAMAVSLEAFRRYFAPGGPAWAYERQALVKLRPIAGNAALGEDIVRLRDQFVYTGEPFDVLAMRAMRERQVRHLVSGGTFNAKYSPGGLVDVEYLVQGLQITHGYRDPSLRTTNIREAMAALAAAGILSDQDYVRLRKAHTFLRWLIDGLRMVRGNAKDLTAPRAGSEALAFLARRLRYGNDVARLCQDLENHTRCVQELNRRLLSS